MKLQQLWQKYLNWVLILWIVYGILAHPGWIVFVLGLVAWVVLVYLTAPGVFWTYVYLFPSKDNYDTEKTIARLERAIAKKPLITLPYYSLGVLYARNNRWQEAIPPLEEAIRLGDKKEQVELKMILAVAFREIGAYDEAFQILDRLMAQGVQNYKIYYNYAMCYLRLNRFAEAVEAAQKARRLKLDSAEPVLLLGKIHFAMGEYAAAKDDYEWAIAHTNWPVESYYWLGRTELELGNYAHAVECLQKAVERITADPVLSDVPATEAEEWLARAQTFAGRETADGNDTERLE